MKKLGLIFGSLFILFIGIIVVVPFVVDVDRYRPQIVNAVNQQINGKLEVGKLALSLWGQVRIEVSGLKLKDGKGSEIVTVKDAFFHIPFLSLFAGEPVLTFHMQRPVVSIVKNRLGQLNVMSLIKKSERPTGDQIGAPVGAKVGSPAGSSSQSTPLPGIVARAKLGVELESAVLSYKDEASGLVSDIKDLNLTLKDISLSHPTELELWADLDTKVGKTFLLQGPARLMGKAQPELKEGKIDHVNLNLRLDLDSVEMKAPGLFEKKKGIPTNVEFSMTASDQEAKIEKLMAKFFNVEMNVQGTVTHLTSTSPTDSSPIVNLSLKSNEIQFGPWVELVPLLKAYELGGAAKLEAELSGPSQKMNYRAKVAIKDLSAKSPQLKTQPKIDGVVNVATDQIESLNLTLKAPANDLKVQGQLISFTHPKANFTITSTGMDLDQLIEFPPPQPKDTSKTPETQESTTQKTTQSVPLNYDELLAPLRENQIAVDSTVNISLSMGTLKAKGVKASDIGCKFTMKDLAMGLEKCGLKVFSGNVYADAHFQLKPKTPVYRFNAKVDGLNIKQAIESQMALFKNTMTGLAYFSMNGQGASFNPSSAISNLRASGNLKVAQAAFVTIDVNKMVTEALNKAINQIGEKIPGAKGKTIGNLPSRGTQYEFISSDFTISDGKFVAPNFHAKALPNQGIDLKGKTAVGLKDNSLDTTWDVIDTYNLTHARDLSVEQNGVKVDHILAEGNSPVHFPVHAGCTIMAPCYSYTEVFAALGKVALNNVASALGNRAKEEARKQADSLIKKVAPPAIQNQLRDKLKGLFH